jgi:hypothetical protein
LAAEDEPIFPSPPPQATFSVDIENPSDQPMYVWASATAFNFDPDSGRLTVHLNAPEEAVPPGIILISEHPRTPDQVEVPPHGQATVNITAPRTIRREVPGEGLGMSYTEEPVEHVRSLTVRMRYADTPFEARAADESPDAHSARLRSHGRVVEHTLDVTE